MEPEALPLDCAIDDLSSLNIAALVPESAAEILAVRLAPVTVIDLLAELPTSAERLIEDTEAVIVGVSTLGTMGLTV